MRNTARSSMPRHEQQKRGTSALPDPCPMDPLPCMSAHHVLISAKCSPSGNGLSTVIRPLIITLLPPARVAPKTQTAPFPVFLSATSSTSPCFLFLIHCSKTFFFLGPQSFSTIILPLFLSSLFALSSSLSVYHPVEKTVFSSLVLPLLHIAYPCCESLRCQFAGNKQGNLSSIPPQILASHISRLSDFFFTLSRSTFKVLVALSPSSKTRWCFFEMGPRPSRPWLW